MSRNHQDWLKAFMEYASFGEAPPYMHFWTGVSVLAGVLQRKVWIDMGYFQWYPNFYIILVAPPGIVQKSTTAGIGMNLLRQVPGTKFGPDVVTWPALVECFAEATSGFQVGEETHVMSALTLESSEFGNLLNPQDREMVDLLVHLWDGKPGAFNKRTKSAGNDAIENPWINIIACTTPSWLAGNFPEYMIGGGFTSRCLFVYAEKKAKLVAYPSQISCGCLEDKATALVEDLNEIAEMTGEYKLTPAAFEWGEAWYKQHYASKPAHLDDERFGGYIARKQSHTHKLAMILAASTSQKLEITEEHLEIATTMTTDLETDMTKAFSKIGKAETSVHVDRLLEYIQRRKKAPYKEVYQFVHTHFPRARDFEDVLAGCVKAGYLKLVAENGQMMVVALQVAV